MKENCDIGYVFNTEVCYKTVLKMHAHLNLNFFWINLCQNKRYDTKSGPKRGYMEANLENQDKIRIFTHVRVVCLKLSQ